ncbi:mannitol dehydrogenase family protein [Thalassobius sp. MITS945101]|uniref:mannitol dehydrogenase family protein n=1 Tax=Thalassobius sp. MITS945101 TaxID=3096994 RepID=UPI003999A94F
MNSENKKRLRRAEPAPKAGIVHLGLGAFFRAHGAIYIKEAMAQSGGDWGVVGVSLRSPGVRDKLVQQGCLYTALELSGQGLKCQVVDVVTSVLVAPEDPNAVLQELIAKATRIVSLTVTEKGYCRGGANTVLDFDHPDIKHDLQNPTPRSAPGFLVRALEMRWRQGMRPFTVLSLDNLPENGKLTRQIVCEFAARIDPDLVRWIEAECKFPCTMVDRIVPATTEELIDRASGISGYHDPAVVAHEPFRQWVIEDDFVDSARPAFEAAGAQLVDDVESFEHLKLRMLNGTHSALAYLGRLAGYETVAEAIRDEGIEKFIEALWREEIATSLDAPPDADLDDYAAQLKSRYQNAEIRHLLEQISMDGSQKLPQRILAPLFENLAAGKPYQRLLVVLAAWFRFIEIWSKNGQSGLNDPIEKQLLQAVSNASNDADLVERLLQSAPVFGDLPTHRIADELVAILGQLGDFHDTARLEGIRL